ncbi:Uma2 family endonuclease [Streptomyces sp. S.PB5]|uniref:Uma2 family endonuclease n=1 Tax=Streptomyces sp. S.PB5 TaxID=3020844 RepID=UPI0025AF83B0|nr:Uma2 family endonuclease [Streptomyces sp. S.PB5]MDN3024592.1 Uma2 family endonuclease [Streptomyces sp. S.PB5]
MTPMTSDHQPQMLVEDFEELARKAHELVRLEFINGKVVVKPVPDGNHSEIIAWLQRMCMQHRPDLWLYSERELRIEEYRKGRARPDGALAPRRHFVGAGEWAEPDGVLMAVEVTSRDQDTNQRDRIDKPLGYAAAGIPVYLLIDRDASSVVVYADPDKGEYRSITSRAFGAAIDLPDPVGFTLDTEELKEFAD